MKALLMAALVVLGLFVAGSVVIWAVHALLGLIVPLLIGALVVGGVVYLVGKSRKSVNGSRRSQLR